MPPPLLSALTPAELWPLLLALVAGAAAVYLLLPRPRPYPSWWGALAGAAALVVAGLSVVRAGAADPETVLFYVFSCTGLLSGSLLVTQHKPARAALSFALVILSVSGLFLLLAAPFLAAATITVYAGAIIVTFLFVIMLAQQTGVDDADSRSHEPALSTFVGFLLLGALVYVLQLSYEKSATVRVLDELLAATGKPPADFAQFDYEKKVITPLREAFDVQEKRGATAAELGEVRHRVEQLTIDWPTRDPAAAEKRYEQVVAELKQARQRHGFLLATGAPSQAPLSDQSGPAANTPPELLRYGKNGRPLAPHDNSAYLGRSLFTDFLLPVELGGVLLLVAAVGAIAIAHRNEPERRS
jgi:NADH:ubiquinone oxidoreductase subunit 6 (subunit J)